MKLTGKLIISLLLFGLLAGCGGKDKTETAGESKAETQTSTSVSTTPTPTAPTGTPSVSVDATQQSQAQQSKVTIRICKAKNGKAGKELLSISSDNATELVELNTMLNEAMQSEERIEPAEPQYVLSLTNANGETGEVQLWYDGDDVCCYSEQFMSTSIGPAKATSMKKERLEQLLGT